MNGIKTKGLVFVGNLRFPRELEGALLVGVAKEASTHPYPVPASLIPLVTFSGLYPAPWVARHHPRRRRSPCSVAEPSRFTPDAEARYHPVVSRADRVNKMCYDTNWSPRGRSGYGTGLITFRPCEGCEKRCRGTDRWVPID